MFRFLVQLEEERANGSTVVNPLFDTILIPDNRKRISNPCYKKFRWPENQLLNQEERKVG